MHHDKGVAKYFSYLNLFLFNMLLLVLGDNLLVMFFLLLRDVQIEPYLKRSCINYYLLHHYYTPTPSIR